MTTSTVVLEKVNTPHAFGVLTQLGLSNGIDKGDTKKIVATLEAHFVKLAGSAGKLAECEGDTGCGGFSDPSLSICPFCADGSPVDSENGDDTVESTTSTKANKKDGAAKAQKGAANMKTETTSTKGKGDKPGPAKSSTKEENGKKSNGATTNGAALARTDTKDLDACVVEIKRIAGESALSYHKIGLKLDEVNAKSLWKNRQTEDGKVAYKSFDQWVQAEIGISAPTALRAIDVAKAYTEEQVRTFGMQKLALVLQAPKEVRQEIEQSLKEGATYRETQAKVKDARAKAAKEGKTVTRDTGRGTPAQAEARAKARTAKSKKSAANKRGPMITVASLEGAKTIKLFCKENKEKRAKKLADQPFGVYEAENGTLFKFAVKEDSAGELVITMLVKRADE